MRYLVVPSKETQVWREFLNSNNWLEKGLLIEKEGENRAIPLSKNFPEKVPTNLQQFKIINKNTMSSKIYDYLGHLEKHIGSEKFDEFSDLWPQSYDQIGEIIIIKIPEEIEVFAKEIGISLLFQNKKITRIFQDLGVQGEFRIRNLKLIGGPKNLGGETKIKENGVEFIVDPTKGYYSPRLANERAGTVESAISLKNKLGRELNICDAYAGFGPALIPLLKKKNIVKYLLANDLNSKITNTLRRNLIQNNKDNCIIKIDCMDARKLINYSENKGRFDLLLVNLPHSTLEHLPSLIELLNNNSTSLLKAWCIIEENEIEVVKNQIIDLLNSQKYLISKIVVNSTRSYSPTQIYAKIEVWIN
ncbi:MAG: hypothetical protein CMB64_01080 [Euryarchaeota archaeon]|nr:hypothetical protein [Euryarchaeota archaeon]